MIYLLIFDGLKKYPEWNVFTVKISLVMITGSAIANFIDRLRIGAVIDFIDIGIGGFRWYTFNLADAYMVIAEVFLFLYIIQTERRTFRHKVNNPI